MAAALGTLALGVAASVWIGRAGAGGVRGVAPVEPSSVPGSEAPGGPAWAHRSGLACSGVFVHANHPVVLLIHGTGQTVEASWGAGYLAALPTAGYDACAVPLVDDGNADIRLSSQPVARAVGALARVHPSRRVDIVTFSQGGLEARWSLRNWPALRKTVPAVVELGAPNRGTPSSITSCRVACSLAVRQMDPRSSFLLGLNSGDRAPLPTAWTSVFSTDDTIVPPWYAGLPGADEVRVQSVCPGRRVGHGDFLTDGAVFRIVLARLDRAAPEPASVCEGAVGRLLVA
jgi:triacylglycerol lipase